MGAIIIDGIMLLLVWDVQNNISTIQQRHITKYRIMERYNVKDNRTSLCDHEMRYVLMKPS
jgi:hypothetical protein